MSKLVIAGVGLPAVLLSAGAAAHHSFAAHFQMDTFAEVEGRVTDVRWVNPHVKIFVRDAAGDAWEVEAGPLNLLTRMGIEPVTDPVILAEPWSWGGSFIYRDGAELKEWNCGAA
jgi:hypothetical protein